MYNYYCDCVNLPSVTELIIFTLHLPHFPLPRSFHPLPHNRRLHRPFFQIRQLTHIYVKILIGVLDDFFWEGEEDLEEQGGGEVLRSHHVIWEVGNKFWEQIRALIHMSDPFQSIYLCVLDLLLLFHLPVLRNQSALSLHWCIDIDHSWWVRVHSSALFLSIPVLASLPFSSSSFPSQLPSFHEWRELSSVRKCYKLHLE